MSPSEARLVMGRANPYVTIFAGSYTDAAEYLAEGRVPHARGSLVDAREALDTARTLAASTGTHNRLTSAVRSKLTAADRELHRVGQAVLELAGDPDPGRCLELARSMGASVEDAQALAIHMDSVFPATARPAARPQPWSGPESPYVGEVRRMQTDLLALLPPEQQRLLAALPSALTVADSEASWVPLCVVRDQYCWDHAQEPGAIAPYHVWLEDLQAAGARITSLSGVRVVRGVRTATRFDGAALGRRWVEDGALPRTFLREHLSPVTDADGCTLSMRQRYCTYRAPRRKDTIWSPRPIWEG